jgi:PAS domain S-box-containing protein
MAQADYDRLFNLSPDLIAVADFEGHFRRVNPAVEHVLGYTKQELLARPYLDFVHPEDRERAASEGLALEQGDSTLSFENRYVRKDGSSRVLEWTSTPVVEDGLTYAMARDVTERRQAEAEVERLADEQAALRRVATLVAQGASPADVFDAVAAEMKRVLDADGVTVGRYEPDSEVTVLAHGGTDGWKAPPDSCGTHEGDDVASSVRRSERPARIQTYTDTDAAVGELVENRGVQAAVGAPVVVEGRLWGVIIANWRREPPPAGTEERMAQFARLLDTAIANADSRDQLTASRARLVTEADDARRRVTRDLHDGAQQRLVHAIIMLKLARRAMRANDETAEELVDEALQHAEQSNLELRELAHGILPPVITHGGLRAGVDAVVERLDLPVEVRVPAGRFSAEIEASAYFIVAEALTNVIKHAHATRAAVAAWAEGEMLRVEVRDDGLGGADPEGRGLLGLRDRATALGGRLDVDSPDRAGTVVTATLPLRAG